MRYERSISTIVPVHDEADVIEGAIEAIEAFLSRTFIDYEIIIVESGSTDGSAEICDRIGTQRSRVRTRHEPARRGFGSALRLGFGEATKDLVWAVSADLPFPLDAIHQAMPLLDDHGCVLSYRCEDDRGRFRQFQSVVYNALAKAMLGLRVRHVNSQLKLYHRDVIQRLPLQADGWLIDTEVVYRLERSGTSYAEIPVALTDRTSGTSTVGVITPFTILWYLAKFTATRWSDS